MVDYRDTSQDFWEMVQQNNPIAIMSFSLGNNDHSWELEATARNLAQNDWINKLEYLDNNGVVQTQNFARPYAGGSAADFSPYKGQGTIAGNPPDPTNAAGATRASNLPMDAIAPAISNEFPNPPGNVVPKIDNTGNVGAFVSEYMAYHVAWYRDYINAKFPNDPAKQCKIAGHTHVGIQVATGDGVTAVDIQLKELFKKLP